VSRQDPPRAVRVDGWSTDDRWPGSRSGIRLVGFFLIVLGLLFGAGQLFSQAQIGASGFFLAVGLVLVFVGFRDRSDLALYAGVFVSALAFANLLSATGTIHGSGWGTLFLGLGVAAVALIRSSAGRRWSWTLGFGAFLALWGGSDVFASNTGVPTDRLIGPLLIVLLGLYIVTRSTGARDR
jgi:hypothetical protein